MTIAIEETNILPLQVIEWKIDDIGMLRQSIVDMRDPEHPIFNQLVRQHNQKIHDFRQGKV